MAQNRFKYFLLLTRPLNVVIGMFSIFMGAFITGTVQPLFKVFYASLSGGIIAGAANAINDYYDIAIDKINKPHRPLAAGIIAPKEGFIFSLALFIAGIAIGALINTAAFALSLFASVLLFFYSYRLKRTVLWGNLTVSLITALAFIYGGLAVNRIGLALIPAFFSFFYHFGREIIKDVEDVAGDRADGVATLPIRHGEKPALIIATAIYCLLILLTLVPYIIQVFGWYYLVMVVLVVDGIIIYVLITMWKNPSPTNLSRLSLILKLNMFAGLIAIYLGKF